MSIKALTPQIKDDYPVLVQTLIKGQDVTLIQYKPAQVPLNQAAPLVASAEMVNYVDQSHIPLVGFKKVKAKVSQAIYGQHSVLESKILKILNQNVPGVLHEVVSKLPIGETTLENLFGSISKVNFYTDKNFYLSAVYRLGEIIEKLYLENSVDPKHEIHIFILEILIKRHIMIDVKTNLFYALARICIHTDSVPAQKVLLSLMTEAGDAHLKLFCLDLLEVKQLMPEEDLSYLRLKIMDEQLLMTGGAFKEEIKNLETLKKKMLSKHHLSLSEFTFVTEVIKNVKDIIALELATEVYLLHETYSSYINIAVHKLISLIPEDIFKTAPLQHLLNKVIEKTRAEVWILRKRSTFESTVVRSEQKTESLIEIIDGKLQLINSKEDFEKINNEALSFASTPDARIPILRAKINENAAVYRRLMHQQFQKYRDDFGYLVQSVKRLDDIQVLTGNYFRNYLLFSDFIHEKFDENYFKYEEEVNELKMMGNDKKIIEKLLNSKLAEHIYMALRERKFEAYWLYLEAGQIQIDPDSAEKTYDGKMTYSNFIKNKYNFSYFTDYDSSRPKYFIKSFRKNYLFFSELNQYSIGTFYYPDSVGLNFKLLYSEFFENTKSVTVNERVSEYFYHPAFYGLELLCSNVIPAKRQTVINNNTSSSDEVLSERLSFRNSDIHNTFNSVKFNGRDYFFNPIEKYKQIAFILKDIILGKFTTEYLKSQEGIEFDKADIGRTMKSLLLKEFPEVKNDLKRLKDEFDRLSVLKRTLFKNKNMEVYLTANKNKAEIKIHGKIRNPQNVVSSKKSLNGFVLNFVEETILGRYEPETIKVIVFHKKIKISDAEINLIELYDDLIKMINTYYKP